MIELMKAFRFTLAVSELAAAATATAGSSRHHALKYRRSLETVVAIAVVANVDMALLSFGSFPKDIYTAHIQHLYHHPPLLSNIMI